MFDIGWSEFLVVAVVLVVVVGPKDLPQMLRTFGRATGQMRRMAGDFRRQFDEALRESELDDVRSTVRDIRKLDPTSDIRKAMNPMRAVGDEIRSSLSAAVKAPEPKVPAAQDTAKPVGPEDAVAAETPAGTPSTAAPAEPVNSGANSETEKPQKADPARVEDAS
ncbi:Sec-independent protein translocase protein TatB [Consotaella aegiceratis]|uniref:Sec-independent protein translocase protein TatB n=1 Tax=Consotaella aegiceratis TaxID=3097961 RepID=UPI003D8090B7